MEASDWYRSDAGVQCQHATHNLWTSHILPTFSKKKTSRHQMDYARGRSPKVAKYLKHLWYWFLPHIWPTCLARAHLISETFRFSTAFFDLNKSYQQTQFSWVGLKVFGALQNVGCSWEVDTIEVVYPLTHSVLHVLICSWLRDVCTLRWLCGPWEIEGKTMDIEGWYWTTMASRGTQGAK